MSDDYLEINSSLANRLASSLTGSQQHDDTCRWFNIAKQLPMELQAILCRRTYGCAKQSSIRSLCVDNQAKNIFDEYLREAELIKITHETLDQHRILIK